MAFFCVYFKELNCYEIEKVIGARGDEWEVKALWNKPRTLPWLPMTTGRRI
jgi:hypothetical protein